MQANGLVERFNQTVQNMLRKFIGEKKESWDTFLDPCIFAYNTSRHKSTLHTPFEVMFGRQAILPVELDGGKNNEILQKLEDDSEHEKATEILKSCRKDVLQRVKTNIIKAQKKQKEDYDKKHAKPPSFNEGAKVLKRFEMEKKKRRQIG